MIEVAPVIYIHIYISQTCAWIHICIYMFEWEGQTWRQSKLAPYGTPLWCLRRFLLNLRLWTWLESCGANFDQSQRLRLNWAHCITVVALDKSRSDWLKSKLALWLEVNPCASFTVCTPESLRNISKCFKEGWGANFDLVKVCASSVMKLPCIETLSQIHKPSSFA